MYLPTSLKCFDKLVRKLSILSENAIYLMLTSSIIAVSYENLQLILSLG